MGLVLGRIWNGPEMVLFPTVRPFFIFGCAGSLLLLGLSLVGVSGGYSLLQHVDFSLLLLLLWSTGSRVHRLQ